MTPCALHVFSTEAHVGSTYSGNGKSMLLPSLLSLQIRESGRAERERGKSATETPRTPRRP